MLRYERPCPCCQISQVTLSLAGTVIVLVLNFIFWAVMPTVMVFAAIAGTATNNTASVVIASIVFLVVIKSTPCTQILGTIK